MTQRDWRTYNQDNDRSIMSTSLDYSGSNIKYINKYAAKFPRKQLIENHIPPGSRCIYKQIPYLRFQQRRPLVRLAHIQVPAPHQRREPGRNNRRVIHVRGRNGHRIREAVEDDPDAQKQARDRRDGEPEDPVPQREGPLLDAGLPAQQVRHQGGEVGQGDQDGERPHHGLEGDVAAEVDQPHGGAEAADEQDGGDGGPVARVHAPEDVGEGDGAVAGQGPEGAGRRHHGAEGGAEKREQQHDGQADGARRRPRRLVVDLREGEGGGALEHGVPVRDGVEERDEVDDGAEEAGDHLHAHGDGDVDRGPGHLLRHVRRAVRRPDVEGPVEHAQDEDEPVAAVSRVVLPVAPDEGRASPLSLHHLPFYSYSCSYSSLSPRRQNSQSHDRYQPPAVPQRHEDVIHLGQGAVREQEDCDVGPGQEQVHDEDVPALDGEALVGQGPHLQDGLAPDGGQGRAAERVRQRVPVAREEADDPPQPPAARRQRRPVVDAGAGRDRRGELRETGCYEEIEEACCYAVFGFFVVNRWFMLLLYCTALHCTASCRAVI